MRRFKRAPSALRGFALCLETAASYFEDFNGTDSEDHAEALRNAAKQFREDADEYEAYKIT